MANHLLGRRCIAYKVALAGRIAPLSLRVPVPRLDEQVSILAITDYTPTGLLNLSNLIGAEEHISGIAGYAVNRRTESVKRAEFVHYMTGRYIHLDGLGVRGCARGQREKAQRCSCHKTFNMN